MFERSMSKEIWKPVVGFEGRYEVSNLGRVKSLRRFCKSPKSNSGRRVVPEKIFKGSFWGPYLAVTLRNGDKRVRKNIQSLVLEVFIGPRPKGMEICHNDGRHTNNRLTNLRYDTRAGNFSDKWEHGTMPHGENHHEAKLKEEDVLAIKRSTLSRRTLANKYNVDYSTVVDIVTGRCWKHLSSNP